MRTSQATSCKLIGYTAPTGGITTYELGLKQYELTNHLGNVLSTVSDKKIPHTTNGTDIDYYLSDITSATDYYPFGSPMDGRTFSSEKYRFGFNGQEKDDEIAGEGNYLNFKYRIEDTRLCRFFAIDPLTKKYPELTPYQVASLSPIWMVEIEGLEGTPAEKVYAKNALDLALNNYAKSAAERVVNYNKGVEDYPAKYPSKTYIGGASNSCDDWYTHTLFNRDKNLVVGMYKLALNNGKILNYTMWVNVSIAQDKKNINYVSFTDLKTNPNGENNLIGATTPRYVVQFWSSVPDGTNDAKVIAEYEFLNKEDFIAFKELKFDQTYEATKKQLQEKDKSEKKSKSKPKPKPKQEPVCFLEGTLILTNNGFKNIESVVVGDSVYSYNFEKNYAELNVVSKTHSSYYTGFYNIISGQDTISVTSYHPFYSVTSSCWKQVKDLKKGEILKTKNNEIEISDILYDEKTVKVYNIQVLQNHNYFVSNLMVLVHNK